MPTPIPDLFPGALVLLETYGEFAPLRVRQKIAELEQKKDLITAGRWRELLPVLDAMIETKTPLPPAKH